MDRQQVRPVIKAAMTSVKAKEGDRARMECVIDAYPPPDVSVQLAKAAFI